MDELHHITMSDGQVVTFMVDIPVAYLYFVDAAQKGLPALVCLHGGGGDVIDFRQKWPFYYMIDPKIPFLADKYRFVVITILGQAYGTEADNVTPKRGWNQGFPGNFYGVRDDSAAIDLVFTKVRQMLQTQLTAAGITGIDPIDPDRRYLFGYSMGGMMACKVMHDTPNVYAAIFMMAGAASGRSHDGLTATVDNYPIVAPVTGKKTSLFAWHGVLDDTVPPGGVSASGLNRAIAGDFSTTAYSNGGATAGTWAQDLASSYRTLYDVGQAWAPIIGLAAVAVLDSTEPALLGGSTSSSYTYGASNRQVVLYYDPQMGHSNYFSPGHTLYMTPKTIWDWLYLHPRV